MPIVADAAVAVRGDMSKFNNDLTSGLNKGTKQAEGFGSKLKGALTPGNLMAAGGIGFGLAQVTSFMGDAVAGAAEYEDALSAVGVIFGEEMIPQIKEWGDEAAANFGAGNTEAIKAANVVATLGKSAGLAGEDLVGFSTDMVQLGGDLASMFGGSTTDAITAVGAALRGESEPIRRYGVLLDDATLRQRAFEMGLIDTTNEALKPNIKVLAAQAEILSQTTDAQGDFLRTSDGMANTQRRLAAEFSNVVGVLGEKLLPIALDLATFVGDDLIPILSQLIDIGGAVGSALATVGDVLNTIAGSGRALREMLTGVNTDTDEYRETVEAARVKLVEFQDDSYEAYAAIQTAAVEGMTAAREVTEKEAFRIAAVVPDEIRARWQDTRSAAFQMAVEHAKGILDGQNQVKVAFEVLTQLQEEEQTRAQRISYLKGVLSSSELAAGLNDGRPGVSGAARALRGQIEAELASLGVNAYNSGYSIGREVARGIYNSAHLADGASSYLAAKVSGYLPRSEPKEGPLRGITKVGHAIVSSITDGIYSNLSAAGNAANALAGALSPSFGTPALAGIPDGGMAAVGPTYIVNVNGVQRTVKSEEEAMQALHDLGAFNGDGRLS